MDSRSISGGKPTGSTDVLDSRQQPAWHVVLLGFFSCGFYLLWWVFKTCSFLKRECEEVNGFTVDAAAEAAGIAPPELSPIPTRRKDVLLDEHTRDALRIFGRMNPALRAVGAAVPVLNMYILTTLSLAICSLVPNSSAFPRRRPLAATVGILAAFLGLLSLSRLPVPWFIVSFLAIAPFALLQHWLNRYWTQVESPSLLVRHGFNLWEMLLIIAGAGLTGLNVAGHMIGVTPH